MPDYEQTIEDLAHERYSAVAEHRELRGQLTGWHEAANYVGELAAAAFIANDDEKARHLRTVSERIRAAGEERLKQPIREALDRAADAEEAHIDAMEAGGA